MVETKIKIDGMMCGMCESHMNDAIRQAFPVKKVASSHSKGEAVVLSESALDEEAVRRVIEQTGYEFKGMTAQPYEKRGFLGFLKK